MARKLSQKKRQQFLQSALKLFVANGVQNASTNAIAKDAGTAAGTLFLYFPTKQDLVHELILDIVKEQSEYVRNLIDPSRSARDTFYAIWEGLIRWFIEHIDAYRYVQQVRDSGTISDEVVQETNRHFGYFHNAIQKGFELEEIKPYPVELIGEFLYRDFVAVMNLCNLQSDPAKQEEYIQNGFEIFWNGIKIVKD
jgi:AcrR family transcriptional regulator